MTMAAYLMKVAATIQPPPDLPGGGSLVSSSNSSKSLLLRPMLPLNPQPNRLAHYAAPPRCLTR
jgi:hypothetical protein